MFASFLLYRDAHGNTVHRPDALLALKGLSSHRIIESHKTVDHNEDEKMRAVKPFSIYLTIIIATSFLLFSESARSQLSYMAGVRLQQNTPGTPDIGNANISGVVKAGQFQANTLDSTAIYGLASATSGVTHGLRGETRSSLGSGVTGINPYSSSVGALARSAYGVYGEIATYPGTTYGGFFRSSTTGGYGVYGEASANGGTANYGGYFLSNSQSGYAVYGRSTGTGLVTYGGYFTTEGPMSRGVSGIATSATGVTYGVFGSVNSLASGYGVYSSGSFAASGTKAFRIDHPIEPTTKYLLHYSNESPFPQNTYLGITQTDDEGYAWVELPEYFEDINAEYKYSLTVVDDGDESGFPLVKVSQTIRGNRFRIRSSAPRVDVSWRVDANRNDLFVRAFPPLDELEKSGTERGKYQHPDLVKISENRMPK